MKKIIIFTLALVWVACEKPEEKKCTASFTDPRDGQEYCITTIGTQTWMAENLRFSSDSAYQNPANPSTINMEYGKLYPFKEAKKVCPAGWHLPTDAEWKTLEITLGMSAVAADGINERGTNEGAKLKAFEGWQTATDTIAFALDSHGFDALPAGEMNPSFGPFFNLGKEANFWTATEYDTTGGAWMRNLKYNQGGITRMYFSQNMSYSCRCVKD